MLKQPRILIVGAGIAGTAAAAFLGRSGHEVTVVERSVGARSSGSPVDVRAEGLLAVRALGVEAALRAHDTGARTLALVDRRGTRVATIEMRTAPDDIEVARFDLVRVLNDTATDVADFRFGDTFTSLAPDDSGVDVTFLSGTQRRFDAVIGADGQHSATRRALWNTERRPRSRIKAMGLTIATLPLPLEVEDPCTVEIHNEPGTSLSLHPAGGRPTVAFIFRSSIAPSDRRDQLDLLHARYASTGWRAGEFLDFLDEAPDMYFDNVQRVSTSSWSRGRVALLGDAAASLTILGNGSSTALAGAHALDQALADGDSIPAALALYEQRARSVTTRAHRGASLGASFLVPRTALGIRARDVAARLMRTI